MEPNFYHFSVGKFKCAALCDGTMDYRLPSFYANAPLADVETALQAHGLPVDHITTPYTHLYVDTGEHRVLVDMGAGHLAPQTGHLPEVIRQAGLALEAIDVVVITHAHPDHIGGTLDDGGQPFYTNAHYYIWRAEWDFWMTEPLSNVVAGEPPRGASLAAAQTSARPPDAFFQIARANLGPVTDRVVRVEREGEIMPGISMIPAPGHTPGHCVVQVSSTGEKLVYIADTVLSPLHLEHPGWLPVYDILPEQATGSKRRVFDAAAEAHTLLMGQHFPPFPSLGHVTRLGDGWLWQPLETGE